MHSNRVPVLADASAYEADQLLMSLVPHGDPWDEYDCQPSPNLDSVLAQLLAVSANRTRKNRRVIAEKAVFGNSLGPLPRWMPRDEASGELNPLAGPQAESPMESEARLMRSLVACQRPYCNSTPPT